MKTNQPTRFLALAAAVMSPASAFACACGCGIYDVGTSSLFPEYSGGTAFFNYTFQDQSKNWSGDSRAPDFINDDKQIRTETYSAGVQYLFNRNWGAQLQIPVVSRTFNTTENAGAISWAGLGDIQLRCLYTGLSDDLSSGLSFGVKLPTGSHDHSSLLGDIDRDSQIGSGSTDVLLGAFHRGSVGSSLNWNWFAQAQVDVPFLKQGDYRPGVEADVALGVYYEGLALGKVKIAPVAQVLGVWRGRDNGRLAAPDDSGYERLLLAPGVEFRLYPVKVYADVEVPVYQHVKGNQLVSPLVFKLNLSYMF
jgi:hypothetical protein